MDGDKMKYRPLGTRVLAVVVWNDIFSEWCVYIDAVEGHDHDAEAKEVARTGYKQDEDLAKVLFPSIAELEYTYTD